MLGHGQRDTGNIHFLKGVGAQHFTGDIAGNTDHGDRIQHGGGDAGDQIGRAGTAGGDGHAHLARGAGVTVSRVRRALLMAH